MNLPRSLLLGLTALVLLSLTSCTELCGQRVCLYYDQPHDQIQVLLFYDGIHEKEGGDPGANQIPAFVADGDIMLLDWPFRLQRKDWVAIAAEDPGTTPALHAFGQALVASVQTHPLGHYRDGHGRIGAAQLITIDHAADFLAKANAAISEAILQQFGGKHDPGWAHTQDKLLDAARHDHPWLSFQGHSLCVSFPVHRGEWATGQTGALVSLLHDIAQAAPPPTPGQDPQAKPADPEPWAQLLGHIQWLSAAPISYSTTDGQVTLRLGDSAQPSVFRLFVRDAYNPQLEATVTSAVPADLDEAIGRRLLQRGSDPAPPGIDAILAWGPPEAQVQGLAAVARGQDPAAAAAAIAKLEEFAATWNKTQGYPPAPEPWADPKQYLFQWRHWGKLMDNYPLSEEHKPLDAPASQPAH